MCLDADVVATALRDNDPASLTLEWKGTDVVLAVERGGADLVVRGGPKDPDRIGLVPISVLGGRTRFLFECGACGHTRKLLHLPHGAVEWRCRPCHGLATARRGRDPVDGLQARWEEIGHEIARLQLLRAFGKSPVVKTLVEDADDRLDVVQLKREVAAVKKMLGRLAPPSAQAR